jgi:inosine-uridine nucleoside N-ribohydrolase
MSTARGFLLAFVGALAFAQAATATSVWIDADPSIGAPYREVDDAFALVLAFHSPELKIRGISTTFGNARLKRTTQVTRELVEQFGAPAGLTAGDVHPGARSKRDRAQRSAATDALGAALRNEKLTYLALGPLTNLAALLEHHPELAARIERVIFVGGRSPGTVFAFGPRGGLQIHDANVVKDPDAVRAVLARRVPIALAPVETSSRLVLTKERRFELRDGSAAAQFLYRKSRVWLWFWTSVVQHGGGPLFDALAVIGAARPELVITEQRHAWVRPTGELVAQKRPAEKSRAVGFYSRLRPGWERFVTERLKARPGAAAVR